MSHQPTAAQRQLGIALLILIGSFVASAILFPFVGGDRLDRPFPPEPIRPKSEAAAIAQGHAANVARMTQIIRSVKAYAADHSGILPSFEAYSAFSSAVRPYDKSPDAPGLDRLRSLGRNPFILNSKVSGRKLASIKHPGDLALLAEPKGEGHSERAIGYLDGHVVTFHTRTEFDRAWKAGSAPDEGK